MITDTTENLKTLIKQASTTIDFSGLEEKLLEAIKEVEDDTGLLDLNKKRAISGGEKAIEILSDRKSDPAALAVELENFNSRIDVINPEEALPLVSWFFYLAYRRREITPLMEEHFKPIVALTNPDANRNLRKLEIDIERYHRFAELSFDLNLPDDNLHGLIIATRVFILPAGKGEILRSRAHQYIEIINQRRTVERNLEDIARLNMLLDKYASLIEPAYAASENGSVQQIDQTTSFVLHACLESMNSILEERKLDSEGRFGERIADLKGKFFKVRFRSSSMVFFEVTLRLDRIEEEASRSIDFDGLKDIIKKIQQDINTYKDGVEGINWLSKYHSYHTRAIANRIYQDIRAKELDAGLLESEIKRIEMLVEALKTVEPAPTMGAIQRIQNQISRESHLRKWVDRCYRADEDKKLASRQRLDNLLEALQILWKKMADTEPQRVAAFKNECNEIINEISINNNYRGILHQIRELEQSINEFFAPDRHVLISELSKTKSELRNKVNDESALLDLINGIHLDIDTYHKRIYYFIDFDNLHSRAALARRWCNHPYFTSRNKQDINNEVSSVFRGIYKLKWRQDKFLSERTEQNIERLNALIQESVQSAIRNPGNPNSWEQLVETKKQIAQSHYLGERETDDLFNKLQVGFDRVRALRSEFAINSSIRFAVYNDELNNILMNLEQDGSRDSAFDAIAQVKPIRANLKEETALLRAHRTELYVTLDLISNTISSVFDNADRSEIRVINGIKSDLETLEQAISSCSNMSDLNQAIAKHKELYTRINSTNMSIFHRKDLRAELERLWTSDTGIAQKLRLLGKERFSRVTLEATIASLIDADRMAYVADVPYI